MSEKRIAVAEPEEIASAPSSKRHNDTTTSPNDGKGSSSRRDNDESGDDARGGGSSGNESGGEGKSEDVKRCKCGRVMKKRHKVYDISCLCEKTFKCTKEEYVNHLVASHGADREKAWSLVNFMIKSQKHARMHDDKIDS